MIITATLIMIRTAIITAISILLQILLLLLVVLLLVILNLYLYCLSLEPLTSPSPATNCSQAATSSRTQMGNPILCGVRV